VAYRPDDEKELLAFCQAEILKYIQPDQYFPCQY